MCGSGSLAAQFRQRRPQPVDRLYQRRQRRIRVRPGFVAADLFEAPGGRPRCVRCENAHRSFQRVRRDLEFAAVVRGDRVANLGEQSRALVAAQAGEFLHQRHVPARSRSASAGLTIWSPLPVSGRGLGGGVCASGPETPPPGPLPETGRGRKSSSAANNSSGRSGLET